VLDGSRLVHLTHTLEVKAVSFGPIEYGLISLISFGILCLLIILLIRLTLRCGQVIFGGLFRLAQRLTYLLSASRKQGH
jgi:hypothetical protein